MRAMMTALLRRLARRLEPPPVETYCDQTDCDCPDPFHCI